MNALMLTLFISACIILGAVILFLSMASGSDLEHHLSLSIKPLREDEDTVSSQNRILPNEKGRPYV